MNPIIKSNEIGIRILFMREASVLYTAGGPIAATSGSAGFDLRADLLEKKELIIRPGLREMIMTGLAIEPEEDGVAGFIYSRSGLGAVKGLVVAQGVGVIDPDYRGEIKVCLLNTSNEELAVKHGERIAQLIFQPFYRASFNQVKALGETGRGAGGFGHTGMA